MTDEQLAQMEDDIRTARHADDLPSTSELLEVFEYIRWLNDVVRAARPVADRHRRWAKLNGVNHPEDTALVEAIDALDTGLREGG